MTPFGLIYRKRFHGVASHLELETVIRKARPHDTAPVVSYWLRDMESGETIGTFKSVAEFDLWLEGFTAGYERRGEERRNEQEQA